MTSQLFTLLGVLVGAMASFFATSGAERARFRREKSVRWDERRLQTYIEFSTTVKSISANASRAREADDESKRLFYLEAMEQGELERVAQFEIFMLLASMPAIEAAHAVNQLIWAEEVATRQKEVSIQGKLEGALNDLYGAARRDLGVDEKAVPR